MGRRQKGQKRKSLDDPPMDKMIRKPEKKKIWEQLTQREKERNADSFRC